MKDISANDLVNNIPLVTADSRNREVKPGGLLLTREAFTVIAGPCTVESRRQIMTIAENVKSAGARMLRGGVFKPLTFPYGDPLLRPDADAADDGADDRRKVLPLDELIAAAEERLSFLREAGDAFDLPVISEVLHARAVSMMTPYVDMFQIGYRHMFNMDLIEELSKSDKPIMIKRHYGESLRSLLGVGEHFDARDKSDFVFCERGVCAPHTHNPESRAIIDIQAIPALNEYAPTVPVFVDPSHSTFKRSYVPPVAKAAAAAGADGLLIEVHQDPENAWVDPLQALGFEDFTKLVEELRPIAAVNGRTI